jgi:hypothetical protein
MGMDAGDWFAIGEAIALTLTWVWVRSRRLSYPDRRRRASFVALLCASAAVSVDLVLTCIMHFVGPARVNLYLFLGFILAMDFFSAACLVFGLGGKGPPRIVALSWSAFLLAQSAETWWMMLTSA